MNEPVKRFDVSLVRGPGYSEMQIEEDDRGLWVRHEDHLAAIEAQAREIEALRAAVRKMHAAKGRHHNQLATCDLYDLVGLPNVRPGGQPENIREGDPYDDPAFEDMARAHDVWGRASGAQCAVFWMGGKHAAQPVPTPEAGG